MPDGDLRLPSGVERGPRLELLVNGQVITAYAGESIAAALTASGRSVLRRAPRTAAPRGIYCGIGVCFECLVAVDGMGYVRSCLATVRAGMRVRLALPPEGRKTNEDPSD
jgi:predicted molibdopterin-dependent oxidoreductase YjgC